MNKKGPVLLLLALLAALPGCGPEKEAKPKKASKKMMTRTMAQGDEFTDVSMPLADADDEMTDDSLKNFFNDMEDEFVAFEDMSDDYRWEDADNVSTLETVYFEFNSKNIDDDQGEKIEFNAEQAKQLLAEAQQDDANAKVVVEGHACSSAGSEEYNNKISLDRANAVADQLAEAGIPRESIEVHKRGNKNPVLKEGTQDEQWVNRRVELHVVPA